MMEQNNQYTTLLDNQKEYLERACKKPFPQIIWMKEHFGGYKPAPPDYNAGVPMNRRSEFTAQAEKIVALNDLRVRRYYHSYIKKRELRSYLKRNPEILEEIKKIQFPSSVYVSIACIIKNEASYIKEWIEFHKLMGVERFLIFDNESTDSIQEVLAPYIQNQEVFLIHFPGKRVQVNAYNLACTLLKKTSRWVACIDADEFLFSTKEGGLPETLKEYEEYPGIGVNWIIYGPCGHKVKPDGGVLENYTFTFSDQNHEMNCRIKSILQPSQVLSMLSPHHAYYKHGRYAVDENKKEIRGEAIYARNSTMTCTMENHTRLLRINHYWTKSLSELQVKCQRGYPDGNKNPEYEKILDRLNVPMVEDTCILGFLGKRSEFT